MPIITDRPKPRTNGVPCGARWRLIRRVDRTKPLPATITEVSSHCQRCGRGLRHVDLLESADGVRLAAGKQCSKRLREGGAHA